MTNNNGGVNMNSVATYLTTVHLQQGLNGYNGIKLRAKDYGTQSQKTK